MFILLLFALPLALIAQQQQQEMLAAHNAVRARVGVSPLIWSDRLAAHAQQWSDQLLARRQFLHRPESPYGENLFAITGGAATPAEVVNDWADESRHYDAANNRCQAGAVCGHYTQVVWGSTREVGCGVARGSGRREIWVCNYDPPGNWVGRRPY